MASGNQLQSSFSCTSPISFTSYCTAKCSAADFARWWEKHNRQTVPLMCTCQHYFVLAYFFKTVSISTNKLKRVVHQC